MLLITLLTLGHATRAGAANEPMPDEAQLEEAIQQGIALRKAGNDEAALTQFLELEQRDPNSIRILLHVTAAAQATGRWMMAHSYLQKASARKNDPYFQRHRAAIKTIEESIAQRVGQVRVLGTPVGAEVRLNGQVVGSLPMGEPRAVEVGSYVLEVSQDGYYPLRRPIVILGGTTLSQEAVELGRRDLSRAGSDPAGSRTSSSSGEQVTHGPQGWWSERWVTWTLLGVTAAATATSGVAFVLRENSAEHWNDDSRCLDSQNVGRTREQVCGDVRRDADRTQTVGITAGVAAVAFGGATLAHWLATPSSTTTRSASSSAHSGCSPGLGSVLCYGSF